MICNINTIILICIRFYNNARLIITLFYIHTITYIDTCCLPIIRLPLIILTRIGLLMCVTRASTFYLPCWLCSCASTKTTTYKCAFTYKYMCKYGYILLRYKWKYKCTYNKNCVCV